MLKLARGNTIIFIDLFPDKMRRPGAVISTILCLISATLSQEREGRLFKLLKYIAQNI